MKDISLRNTTSNVAWVGIDGTDYCFRFLQPSLAYPNGAWTVKHGGLGNNSQSEYNVYLDADGHPLSCTCPHCHYRKVKCKHITSVELIQKHLKETP